MSDDPLIQSAESAEATDREARAANLFDLRRIIAALFLVYGVILVVVGLTDSRAEIDKAGGIHINLWTGIALLVTASLFLAWARLRPLGRQLAEAEAD